MRTENRLRLHEIAQRLEAFTIDNGPMGESRPFRREADELHRIASQEETVYDMRRRQESEGGFGPRDY